jgi:hypothetical protein
LRSPPLLTGSVGKNKRRKVRDDWSNDVYHRRLPRHYHDDTITVSIANGASDAVVAAVLRHVMRRSTQYR